MVCDAAVYPGLAITYASTLFPELLNLSWITAYVYKSIYTFVLFGLLLLGIRPVGVALNVLLAWYYSHRFCYLCLVFFKLIILKIEVIMSAKNY